MHARSMPRPSRRLPRDQSQQPRASRPRARREAARSALDELTDDDQQPRASRPRARREGARGALDELTDDDQECDPERNAPERGNDELTACRPPSALPARLDDRQLLKLTLRAARVCAVSVALNDTAVAAVDEQLHVRTSCDFAGRLPRSGLCVVARVCACGAIDLDAPAFVSWDYVDVALRHAAPFPEVRAVKRSSVLGQCFVLPPDSCFAAADSGVQYGTHLVAPDGRTYTSHDRLVSADLSIRGSHTNQMVAAASAVTTSSSGTTGLASPPSRPTATSGNP